jgi:uncharacterized membrane protein YgcG
VVRTIRVVVGRLLCALLVLLWTLPAVADERIRSYDIAVDIRADGSLDVTERIRVRAEGSQIRRGIYRDFPTRYRDRYGNRVVVGFELLDVRRNGEPEPNFTERVANGIRINTGNDDFLQVPAEYTFTLSYRTTRQIGFFADHDELYWNAIGTGWIFPIDEGRVEVRLPEPVPEAQMRAEGYTGPQGAQGQAYTTEIAAPGLARWRLAAPLAPYEGFTIVLSFPKGIIPAPSRGQRLWWLLADNRGVLVALGGLAGLVAFCSRRWRQVGRDPRAGVIIPRYEPPEGHTPADLRYVRRMGYDTRCFSSDVLDMAVAGQLRIHREDRLFKDAWWLERTGEMESLRDAGHRTLITRLFKGGAQRVDLKKANAKTLSEARQAHSRALEADLHPRYFQRNVGSVVGAVVIGGVTAALAFFVAGGAGIPAIVAVLAGMALTIFLFARLVRAPTKDGRALLDQIEGLKLYLSVAERDELQRMPGPGAPPVLDAKRYERLLPFAVALEVEDAWTAKFTAAVGAAAAAAATSGISWYQGGGVSDLGSLSHAVGSSLSSQIASSSSPPGSSSGRGGGGSSGGGGGGGGGGGR